jgi:hypothetical protein
MINFTARNFILTDAISATKLLFILSRNNYRQLEDFYETFATAEIKEVDNIMHSYAARYRG